MNYQNVVSFDPNLIDVWFMDADTAPKTLAGLAYEGKYIVSGAPTAIAGQWVPSAKVYNTIDATWYINTGSTTSPSWTLCTFGGGGSGITQLTGDVTAGPGTGSVPATVTGWHGVSLDPAFTGPSGGNRPWFDGASGTWKLAAQSGDLSGTAGSSMVVGLKNQPLSGSGLAVNQGYIWDGAGISPQYIPSSNSPTYDNNAAAIGAGLTAGMFYIATGGDITIPRGMTMRVY